MYCTEHTHRHFMDYKLQGELVSNAKVWDPVHYILRSRYKNGFEEVASIHKDTAQELISDSDAHTSEDENISTPQSESDNKGKDRT